MKKKLENVMESQNLIKNEKSTESIKKEKLIEKNTKKLQII